MESITNTQDLKLAIERMKLEQSDKEWLLREQFNLTFESLKPINLIKNALHDAIFSPSVAENTLGTLAGLATGYISRKILVGGSSNILRKLLGSLLQFGVSNLVSQHPEAVKSVGQFLYQKLANLKQNKD